jgi:hypothetical protein
MGRNRRSFSADQLLFVAKRSRFQGIFESLTDPDGIIVRYRPGNRFEFIKIRDLLSYSPFGYLARAMLSRIAFSARVELNRFGQKKKRRLALRDKRQSLRKKMPEKRYFLD